MKRAWIGLFVIVVTAGWTQQASAGQWGGKPTHKLATIKSPSRIRSISQPNGHPWALRSDGASWFASRAGIAAAKREFHEFSARNLRRYLNEGRKLDCADVALHNLIDFLAATGRRGAMKIYDHGPKYIDSADFRSKEEFTRFVLHNMGALHVIDNMKPVLLANKVRGPQDLEKIQPGHTRMKVHIPRVTAGRHRKGVPEMGHTEPIVGVEIGDSLENSWLRIIYGNFDQGHALQVRSKTLNVAQEIKPSALVVDEEFSSLGPVRTAVAPVWSYKKMVDKATPSPVAEQAMAMGWKMIESGLGRLGD